MQPAIRTQTDELQDSYSKLTALDCSDLPDRTRQEFKEETDVNYILTRYGANAPLTQAIYGEVDYNMDLQQSLAAIETAQDAVRKLPWALRDKYYHWEMLMEGMRSGEFKKDLDAHLAEERAKQDLTNKGPPITIQTDPKKE